MDTELLVKEARNALGRILTASKTMRDDWRLIGQALKAGRAKHIAPSGNVNDKAYGAWIKANGFGGIDRQARADAMWLDDHWASVGAADSRWDHCHPSHIRQAMREAGHAWAFAAGEAVPVEAERVTSDDVTIVKDIETQAMEVKEVEDKAEDALLFTDLWKDHKRAWQEVRAHVGLLAEMLASPFTTYTSTASESGVTTQEIDYLVEKLGTLRKIIQAHEQADRERSLETVKSSQ